MNRIDLLGYVACLLVLATFSMRGMVTLRLMAIASNLAFIAYAALAGIHPVLLLHALLLPMNAWRLMEIGGMNRHLLIALACCGVVGAAMAGPDGTVAGTLGAALSPATAASAPAASAAASAAAVPDWSFTPRHGARKARR
jgi:hypothetical protein